MISKLILLYLGSYVCGGIPFGVLIARRKGIDLMSVGSGNIGATNVKRVLGGRIALLVFFLDVGKATVPCLVARLVVTQPLYGYPAQVFWYMAGLTAVFGHCVSPFLKFKGGKGVSTALGMVVGAAPLVASASMSLFLVLLITTRYMSLASMIAVGSATLFGWYFPHQARELVPLYFLLTVFVTYRHRKNIVRLREGTEPKFSFKQDKSQSVDNDAEKTEPPSKETKSPD